MKLKQYKGINIEVQSDGRFSAKVDDATFEGASLRDVEEEIDKELKARVARSKKTPLKIWVVALATKKRERYGEMVNLGVCTGIVTGINRTTREITVEFADPEVGDYSKATLLADTPSNRKRLETLESLNAIRDEIQERIIAVAGYGRVSADKYEDFIEALRKFEALRKSHDSSDKEK
jgi:hypothetical protein